MSTRKFSSQLVGANTTSRTLEDAPNELRQEFIDVVYQILQEAPDYDERRLYNIMCQSLGITPVGKPWAGYRHAIGNLLRDAAWERVYDLIIRIRNEIPDYDKQRYDNAINEILAACGCAWELKGDGNFLRVLPSSVQERIEVVFHELSAPQFEPALISFRDGMAAYNERPQRGRDACKNMMDALESVAKEISEISAATFGDVLKSQKIRDSMASETISALQKLYAMANNHFRHGTTSPFQLKSAEVDFVIVTCLGGILLFTHL